MSATGADLGAEYEAAREAVIDAQMALQRAERRLAVATDRMLAYVEARTRHPSAVRIVDTPAVQS